MTRRKKNNDIDDDYDSNGDYENDAGATAAKKQAEDRRAPLNIYRQDAQVWKEFFKSLYSSLLSQILTLKRCCS